MPVLLVRPVALAPLWGYERFLPWPPAGPVVPPLLAVYRPRPVVPVAWGVHRPLPNRAEPAVKQSPQVPLRRSTRASRPYLRSTRRSTRLRRAAASWLTASCRSTRRRTRGRRRSSRAVSARSRRSGYGRSFRRACFVSATFRRSSLCGIGGHHVRWPALFGAWSISACYTCEWGRNTRSTLWHIRE